MHSNMFNDSSQASQIELLKMKILQCHRENITHSKIQNDTFIANATTIIGLFCSKIFDGLLCWDETPAGATAYQNCPSNVYGWSPDRFAYKICNEDGHWFQHPQTTKSWTNYTTCVDTDDFFFRENIITLSIVGYSISFISLCVSMGIFYTYNLLHCTRTKVHMNMFISLALNCISWVLWYTFIVRDVPILVENPYMCRILTMINLYLMCCSYMWMFCEGLNLHISLVVVFVNQVYAMKIFVFIGWILPMILTVAYFCCRLILGDIERCMIDDSHAFYLVTIPVGISMIFSLYFLVRIMMVLINKARNNPAVGGVVPVSGPPNRFDFSKTIKPALLLIPLFGLYFLLMPVHPPLGSLFEIIYTVVVALLTSLQGFIVSVLFCFKNQEVRNQIRQDLERRQRVQLEMNQITVVFLDPTLGWFATSMPFLYYGILFVYRTANLLLAVKATWSVESEKIYVKSNACKKFYVDDDMLLLHVF